MARHATNDRRRGIAAWPIVAVVTVLALIAAVVVYFLVVNRDDSPAAACTTDDTLQIVTSQDTAEAVRAAAQSWAETKPVIRATCITANVSVVDNGVVASVLIAGAGETWSAGDIPAPAVWIVDEETDLLQVDAAQSALTAGRSTTPLATSPVVLAMSAAPAQVPSWRELVEAGGSDLVLPGADSRSTVQAAESLVAASVGTTVGLTPEQVAGSAALLASLGGRIEDAPLDDLLDQVSADGPAVAVQESLLLRSNQDRGADTPVAVHPTGATSGAEVYAVPLVTPWTSPAQQDAAAQFDSYLAGEGAAAFAAAGFRIPGDAARPTTGPDTLEPMTLLPSGDQAVRTAILDGLAAGIGVTSSPAPTSAAPSSPPSTPEPSESEPSAPAPSSAPESPAATPEPTSEVVPPPPAQTGPTVLLLLDRSTSLTDTVDDRSLNEWVQIGVTGLAAGAPQAGLGVWTCGSAAESAAVQVVPPGPLAEAVDGVARTELVNQAMAALTPDGVNHTYGCLNELWPGLSTVPVPDGQQRVVVLVTAGVDRTPSLSRAALLATVSSSADARLEIIGLDSSVNDVAMSEIAAAGGGSYRQIDPADLTTTLVGLSG